MLVETGLAPDLNHAAENAKRAEALGFDGIISTETKHNPFFPLVLAAEHTRRIRLGTGIALAFPRSPMTVAHQAWDLQAYSNGRFELGLGTQVKGHIERRFSTPWTAPGPRMRDYIGALRATWRAWSTGERLNFRSEQYNLTLMTPYFTPEPIPNPEIRICLAAVGDYMCRMAGELCEGVRLHGFSTPKYLAEVTLPNIEKGLARSGRSRKDFTIYSGGYLAMGANQAEVETALKEVRRQVSFYASTRTYHPVLEIHGWLEFGNQMHDMSLRGEWDAMAEQVTDRMVDAFAIVGTYDQIAGEIVKRFAGLVDVVRFQLPAEGSPAEAQIAGLINRLHAA